MFGNVGTVRSTSNPSAGEVSGMIDLLNTMGGDKKIKKLLEKMQEVQAHNETVLADARSLKTEAEAAAAKANVAIDKAQQTEARLAIAQQQARAENEAAKQALAEQEQNTDEYAAMLTTDKATFETERKDATDSIAKIKKNLEARSSELDKRETECVSMQAALRRALEEFAEVGKQIVAASANASKVL